MLPHQQLLYNFLRKNSILTGIYVVTAFVSGLLKITLLMLLGRGYEMLSDSHSAKSALLEAALGARLPAGNQFPLFWLAIASVFGAMLLLERYEAALLGERFAASIRNWVFDRQLQIPKEKLLKNGYAQHLARYGSDLTALKQYLVKGWCRFLSDMLLIFGMLGLLWQTDAVSGQIVLGCILLGMLLLFIWQRLSNAKAHDKRRRQSHLVGFVGRRFEALERAQEVHRRSKVRSKFQEKNDALYVSAVRYHKFRAPATAFAETLPYFTLAAVLASATIRQAPPPISVLILLLAVFPVLRRLSNLPAIWLLGCMSLHRLNALDAEVDSSLVSAGALKTP